MDKGKTTERVTASMACPDGHVASLSGHTIRSDGVVESELGLVNPSVVCPKESCDFHDNVRLVGWRP